MSERTSIAGTALETLSGRLPRAPTASSAGLGWRDVALARSSEPPTELDLPALPDHMVFVHLAGTTRLERGDTPGQRSGLKPFGHGDVNLLSAGRSSSWRWDGHPACAQISLRPALVERVAAGSLDLDPARLEFIDFHAEPDALVQQLGLALVGDMEAGSPAGALFAETIAQALAAHLLRRYASASPKLRPRRSGLRPAILKGVQEYIEAHLSEPLHLADLARVSGYAEAHFAQAFKRATGLSPHRYVLERRVERAKMLLARSSYPLVDVALRTGFQTQSHFSVVFRKAVGTTPGAYRDSARLSRGAIKSAFAKVSCAPKSVVKCIFVVHRNWMFLAPSGRPPDVRQLQILLGMLSRSHGLGVLDELGYH